MIVLDDYSKIPQSEQSSQSESELENELINDLVNSGEYEYKADIKDENSLWQNAHKCIEELNDIKLSQSEWAQIKEYLKGKKSRYEKSAIVFESGHVLTIKLDNGKDKNIKIFDKNELGRNKLQIINQIWQRRNTSGENRYDASVLVNGFPLVHIELKRRGVSMLNAFEQIKRYKAQMSEDSIYGFAQIFIISNGTFSKYFSNTAKDYAFTSKWMDAKNNEIDDLKDFCATFLAKKTLLEVIFRYCVLDSEKNLKVLRPYQIAACERILGRINSSSKQAGSREAGGYIWHTTGSGKTLTSFKTAVLASRLENIKKVLFVVDRKDLYTQTQREYENFAKGSANGANNSKTLKKLLGDKDAKIVITTIQRLVKALNDEFSVYDDEVAIIIDECHRSQFGDMHRRIKERFKRAHIFGFTGTPIFDENASANSYYNTTENLFGDRLHTYNIISAIRDENVLKFNIIKTASAKAKDSVDEQVEGIDELSALNDERRIKNNCAFVLKEFEGLTHKRAFNSIFATSSTASAKLYYNELKRQIASADLGYKIAIIFTGSNNEQSEENVSIEGLESENKSFLAMAIDDFNKNFGFSYGLENFNEYYKKIAELLRDRKIDILVVVDMFLTGFDAPCLNTLWVDKRLKMHGLIQAFSRTNRISDERKKMGNIVCLLNLENEIENALRLYANNDNVATQKDSLFVKGFDEYFGILKAKFDELRGISFESEDDERAFIKCFSDILRLENILKNFIEFDEKALRSDREIENLLSRYDELKRRHAQQKREKTDISDDIEFVPVEILSNYVVDRKYLLALIKDFGGSGQKIADFKERLGSMLGADITLKSKQELIMSFIDKITANGDYSDISAQWMAHFEEEKNKQLKNMLTNAEFKLDENKARDYLETCLHRGELMLNGTDFDGVFVDRGSIFGTKSNAHKEKAKEAFSEFIEVFKEPSAIFDNSFV